MVSQSSKPFRRSLRRRRSGRQRSGSRCRERGRRGRGRKQTRGTRVALDPRGRRRKAQVSTVEARIKYKIERAKLKESLLIEKLKKYEVPQVQGPNPKEDTLTGEERFYMKKMAKKV
ncbi:hypothetical protein HPP92_023395 [Vanilla planifolia]|uniref:Uncharacterized protein n=1 Tax=Vanilla planifolia TaxID=51239 RepID=A0A835UG09_VANPL|nr:hypothetical protein HPP92_023713 [Vanilla planifolia]KAG0460267.1 hypothetical protein HPP92_023395 [Vanilla planifolia]